MTDPVDAFPWSGLEIEPKSHFSAFSLCSLSLSHLSVNSTLSLFLNRIHTRFTHIRTRTRTCRDNTASPNFLSVTVTVGRKKVRETSNRDPQPRASFFRLITVTIITTESITTESITTTTNDQGTTSTFHAFEQISRFIQLKRQFRSQQP